MAKTVRFSMDMSQELSEKLEQLAEKKNTTKSEVLRRAIALFDVAVEAEASGKKLGIADKDRMLETEIIGL